MVEDGEPGYGWTRFDEGGFRRLTWIAEQEVARAGNTAFDQRGRRAAGTVRPLWASGPAATAAPFAAEPGQATLSPTPRRRPRLDFSQLTRIADDE